VDSAIGGRSTIGDERAQERIRQGEHGQGGAMSDKLIGILAGMGPRSTAPFVDMVVSECQSQYGAKLVEDFPHMMIYSLPAPIRLDRPLDHGAVKDAVCGGLRKLAATGVDFIAIPCNTVHIYFDELVRCVDVPLLSIIDETMKAVPRGAKKITLLATRMTVEARLYQRGIERAGLDFVLDERWQVTIDEMITAIMGSRDDTAIQKGWDRLVADVAAAGVDTILLGCTDLNVVSRRLPDGIVLLDATECLARAVVARYRAA
jgi:aspartate racemase